MNEIESVIELLQLIHNKITKDTDVIWAGYDTYLELKNEIDEELNELKKGNIQGLDKIEIWFLPTGTFQELSLSNGWGNEFLILAKKFDGLCKIIKEQNIQTKIMPLHRG